MKKVKLFLLLFSIFLLNGCVENPETRATNARIKESARGFFMAAELQCAKESIENPDVKIMGVETISTEGYLSISDIPFSSTKPTDVNIQFDSNCIASGTFTLENIEFDINADFQR